MTDLVVVSTKDLTDLIKNAVQTVIEENQKNRDSEKLMDAKELCKFLGISLSTLNVWKASAKIPFKRLGKRVFFVKEDVLKTLEDSNYNKIKQLRG